MKKIFVKVNRVNFLSAAKFATSAIDSRPIIPIHSYLKISFRKETTTITGGSENIQVTTQCNTLETQGEFDVCVPADVLVSTLSSLQHEDINFMYFQKDNKTFQFSVMPEKGKKFVMPADSADYFHIIEYKDGSVPFSLESQMLIEIFSSSIKMINPKHLTEVMQGIHMFADDKGHLITYSTDSTAMCRHTVKIEEGLNGEITLATKVADIVIMTGDKGRAEISTNGTLCKIIVGGVTIISRMLVGKYPDVNHIFSQQGQYYLTVNRQNLISALKLAGIYASKLYNTIVIKTEGDKLLIRAEDSSYSLSSLDFVPIIKSNVPEVEVGMDIIRFRKIVDSYNDEDINLWITKPSTPMFFSTGNPSSPRTMERDFALAPISLTKQKEEMEAVKAKA